MGTLGKLMGDYLSSVGKRQLQPKGRKIDMGLDTRILVDDIHPGGQRDINRGLVNGGDAPAVGV